MPLGFWFWLIFVLAILFGGFTYWPGSPWGRFAPWSWAVLFILLGILGFHDFGGPLVR